MSYSTIKIKFTEELLLGQQVGFDVNTSPTFGIPTTTARIENFVTTRSGAGEVTTPITSTGIIGEQSAINYFNALYADLNSEGLINPYGYSISRSNNEVTITAINLSGFGYIEFYVNGIFATYINESSVEFTINNQYDTPITPITPTTGTILLQWYNAFDAENNISGYELSYKTNGAWIELPFIVSSATGGNYSFTPTQQIDHTFRIRIKDTLGAVSGYQYFSYPIAATYQISSDYNNQGPVQAGCQLVETSTFSPTFLSSTPPAVGVTVYTNISHSSIYPGHNEYWLIKSPSGLYYSCWIDDGGVIQEVHLCGGNSGLRSTNGNLTPTSICNLSPTDNIYWNSMDSFVVGTILYTDSDCTLAFNGGGFYYMMQYIDVNGLTFTKVVQVAGMGVGMGKILSVVDKNTVCSIIRPGSRTNANADCNSVITNTCYIASVDPITIATNDIVYTNSQGTIPFTGGDLVYKVLITTTDPINQAPVLCKINNLGKVTSVTGYCSIYGTGGGGGGYGGGGSGFSNGKIICNLLYHQGYLPKEIWKADQDFGRLMLKTNKEGLFGYLIWAKPIVSFLTRNPKYSKYVYLVTKPWSEHMAYMMGVLPNDNKLGKTIHYFGNKFCIMVYKLYILKRRINK